MARVATPKCGLRLLHHSIFASFAFFLVVTADLSTCRAPRIHQRQSAICQGDAWRCLGCLEEGWGHWDIGRTEIARNHTRFATKLPLSFLQKPPSHRLDSNPEDPSPPKQSQSREPKYLQPNHPSNPDNKSRAIPSIPGFSAVKSPVISIKTMH